MVGNMKYQWIGNCRTTRHKGFESSLNKKKLSYQKRHDFFNQLISCIVVATEKAR